jgi:hypothetical protein
VHVVQDQLIDALLGGKLAPAQPGEPLVRRHPLREPAGDAARREAADRQQARLGCRRSAIVASEA